MKEDLSRRKFLYGALAVGATVATEGILAGNSNGINHAEASPIGESRNWDYETDVVVVGTGFAGLAAAYEATKAGSSVLMIEKAPEEHAGGNSRACAQAVWSPPDPNKALSYFKEITSEYHLRDIDDAIIDAYVNGAKDNPAWLLDEFDIVTNMITAIEYPIAKSAVEGSGGTAIPEGGLGFQRLWIPIFEKIQNTSEIELQYETKLTDLIFNTSEEVIGIEAEKNGSKVSIKAKKGVVLCCGGFEFNETMLANYTRAPSLAWGTPYNTGDAISICMKYDIDFWHMNSATIGTRMGFQSTWLDGVFSKCAISIVDGSAAFMWVDSHGKRFMDETRDYQHGYGRTALWYNDGAKMEWPRIPCWNICDEAEFQRQFLLVNQKASGWIHIIADLSIENVIEELTSEGIIVQANSVEELASKMKVEETVLKETFDKFNSSIETDTDEFDREAKKKNVVTGALYATKIWPIMVNTNGGPKRNADASILKVDGTPVPRLYSAGELGSIWAWYYQGAGNVSECMVFGRIAGKNVAALNPWDA